MARKLPPVHPGEILREEFLVPLKLTPYAVAAALNVPRTRIERIAREERPVTADTALRLGKFFDRRCVLDEHAGALRSRNGRGRACAADQENRVLHSGLRWLEYGTTESGSAKEKVGMFTLLQPGIHLIKSLFLIGAIAVCGTAASLATEQPSDIPAWLRSHIGEGEGQIAQVVLQRARALYLKKVAAGAVKNPCYFAMDATRPHGGRSGKRFYTICEADRSFRAVATGHGSGRNIKGVPNFANGKECAKNFGNALDSYLTTGGAYLTAETRTLFKGYYRNSAKQDAVLVRSFVQFDGEGETANARERDIGGHAAVLLRQIHYRWMPRSPYANENGCVPVGTLEDYAGGRSNGCTSWSRSDAEKIIPLLKDPTTLYIYPESADIKAVAASARQPHSTNRPYWNAVCLKQIGAPKFWSKEQLEPILARYHKEPEPAPSRPATCKP